MRKAIPLAALFVTVSAMPIPTFLAPGSIGGSRHVRRAVLADIAKVAEEHGFSIIQGFDKDGGAYKYTRASTKSVMKETKLSEGAFKSVEKPVRYEPVHEPVRQQYEPVHEPVRQQQVEPRPTEQQRNSASTPQSGEASAGKPAGTAPTSSTDAAGKPGDTAASSDTSAAAKDDKAKPESSMLTKVAQGGAIVAGLAGAASLYEDYAGGGSPPSPTAGSPTSPTAGGSPITGIDPSMYDPSAGAAAYGSDPSAAYSTDPSAAYSTDPSAAYSTDPSAAYSTDPSAAYSTDPSAASYSTAYTSTAASPNAAYYGSTASPTDASAAYYGSASASTAASPSSNAAYYGSTDPSAQAQAYAGYSSPSTGSATATGAYQRRRRSERVGPYAMIDDLS